MAIITSEKGFYLQTANTSYVFAIKNGTPVHLYYGPRLEENQDLTYIIPCRERSFAPYNAKNGKAFSLDSVNLEYSIEGKGDFRTPSISLKDSVGTLIYDFDYVDYSIIKGKIAIPDMPYGRDDNNTQTLIVKLRSKKAEILLYYTVYESIDVICTYASIKNLSQEKISIEKLTSATQDLFGDGYKILTLQGRPAFERLRKVSEIPFGTFSLSSNKGASSSYASPFAIISETLADENNGNCYGFNLVYSGNFKLETEYGDHKKLRFNIGVNNQTFSRTLNSGEQFFTPEAIRTFSKNGYNGISINFSDYIRDYIMPQKYAKKSRPVVINTWEAFYFNIDEEKMLDFAKVAKKCGIDTLVIDDGWFSSRRNDDSGLGDWWVAKEIFPSGLKAFVEKVNKIGLNVGIWIEPEMVNPDSQLFLSHPEWILGDSQIQSRNQLVLDFTNPQVVDYIYDSLINTLSNTGITYVKWDMNRFISPFVSNYTKDSREIAHAYILGVYSLISRLQNALDGVMFETCSGGGGRFDAGMMYYSPQIWTSDNTCPFERCYIQAGASYAYPISAMSCHVTETPNGGTRLVTSHDFRFGVALNGALGYEYNLFKLDKEEQARIKIDIAKYRAVEDLILKGDFYRLITPYDNDMYYAYTIVSKDKKRALLSFNALKGFCNSENVVLKLYGLSDQKYYKIEDKVYSGKALRCVGLPMPRVLMSGFNYTVTLKAVKKPTV